MSADRSRRLLMVGALLLLGQALLPVGPGRDLVVALLGAAAVVLMLAAVVRMRGTAGAGWSLLTAGVSCLVLGDVLWGLLVHVAGVDPFPSVADVAYLAAYPALAAGLSRLMPRTGSRRDVGATLDALIVGVVLGLVVWVLLVAPAWSEPGADVAARVVGVAYPVGDAVLVTYVLRLRFSRAGRSTPVRLLTAACGVMLASDVAFDVASTSAPQLVPALDTGWLLTYLLCAAAASHRSAAAVVGAGPAARREGLGRLLFLAVALLLLPAVLLAEVVLRTAAHTTVVAGISAVVVVLVSARMAGMVRTLHQQADGLAFAHADVVTGLLNPRAFHDRVGRAARRATPGRAAPAVLLVGLDRFTEILEALGHRLGDELLREVGTRLARESGSGASVARISGDVFAVLLPHVAGPDQVLQDAHRLRLMLREPFVVDGVPVVGDGAVGVVLLPEDGTDPVELVQRAEVALSAARQRPDRVARYDVGMDGGRSLAARLVAELPAALAGGEVAVWFQPQVDLTTGRVVGAEALVRWDHPRHGMLSPAAFVPAAETAGSVRLLTRHVLESALARCAAWRADGLELSVAVNLSVRNLLEPDLVEQVEAALARHGLPADALELEITETAAMVDLACSEDTLRRLHRSGVSLSVDDYGTGYGSLAYLQRLPVAAIKVDRSFVARVHDDVASEAIVRSVVTLGRRLGVRVVAEGVEDDATLLALRAMGCELGQGYGIARPCPPERVPGVVAEVEARLGTVLRAAAGGAVPRQKVHAERLAATLAG